MHKKLIWVNISGVHFDQTLVKGGVVKPTLDEYLLIRESLNSPIFVYNKKFKKALDIIMSIKGINPTDVVKGIIVNPKSIVETEFADWIKQAPELGLLVRPNTNC